MTIPTVPASERNGLPAAGGYVYRGTKRDTPDALGLAARERQEAFGRAVQAAREALGLLRREVADAARITPAWMSAIEKGQDRPAADVVARIAEALKTTPEALLDPAVRCPPAPAAAERREADLPPADDRRRRSLQPHRGSAGTGPKTPGGAAGTSAITWSVYQLLDAQRALLYVGYSRQVAVRLGAHRRGKPWWPEVADTLTEEFATEDEARRREKEIWATGKPKYNRVSPFRTPDEHREQHARSRARGAGLENSPEAAERKRQRNRAYQARPDVAERHRQRERERRANLTLQQRERRREEHRRSNRKARRNATPEQKERERIRSRRRSQRTKAQTGEGLF